MRKVMALIFSIVLIFSMSGIRGYAMLVNDNDNDMKEGFSIELSDEELEQIHSYRKENVPISNEEIDNYLIENGYNTREEINLINERILSDNKTLSRVKYIDGYNKYRTFVKNGKTHLYLYISGTTLRKIYNGADAAGIIASILPQNLATVIAQLVSFYITSLIDQVGTQYGIVLCFVKDKWVHQGATYTYRYDHWFYQT